MLMFRHNPQFGLPTIAAGMLVCCAAVACLGQASAAAPTLTHLFPAGAQRGTKVSVTCTGSFSWPVMIRAPGVDVVVGTEPGKIEVSVPEDLAADRVWIRLYNAEGASAAVPFLIGNLKEMEDQEPNNAPRSAQAVTGSAVTINGTLQDSDVDGFAVQLTAGQTLVAALDANGALGSPMDAILQVALPDGSVLAENNDDVDLDPRLVYTATTSQTHVVRLFAFPAAPDTTIAFRGGPDYIYRLTLTTGPFVTHAVPLSLSPEDPGVVQVHGWNLPPDTRLPVVPFGGTWLAEAQEYETLSDLRNRADVRLGFAHAANMASGARIRLTPYAVVPGIAQTSGDHPLMLAVPTSVTGWLRKPRQADVFRIPLAKGQQVVIALETRSLGFPLDAVLQFNDPAGAVVADVNDLAPVRASVITHAAAAEGDYVLTVKDRYRQGGERCFYRLTVRLEEPDFELVASADSLVVGPDKPTEFAITVQRRSPPGVAIGPITIAALDLPPGVTMPDVVSEPEGETASKVILTFHSAGAAFSGPIRLAGTASEPQEIHRQVRTPPAFGATFETFWLTAIATP